MSRRILPLAGGFLACCAHVAIPHAQVAPVPGLGPMPFSCGIPVMHNAGTNSNSTGATLTTNVTMPAGALFLVTVSESGTVASGGSSVSDGGTNTYAQQLFATFNGNSTIGAVYSFATGVPSIGITNATITYTKNSSTNAAAMAVSYITGLSANGDGSTVAIAFGTNATPSITSGVPTQAGELFLAILGVKNTVAVTITQDSANGWSAPPNAATVGGLQFFGGNVVNSAKTAKTFAPTLSGVVTGWSLGILGYQHC